MDQKIDNITTKIAVFKGRKVRKTIYNNEWWFSVVDVVVALTDSINPRDYWYRMKVRVKDEDGIELSTICRQLKLQAPDGKMRETDCANTEGFFALSSQSRLQKPSRLSDGWRESVMKE